MDQNRVGLSIFLITFNEAERLGATLEAIKGLTDDLIVVDSGSTDATLSIAESYGAQIIVNTPFPGYGPQKRLAETHCRHDWILNLDADEVVSKDLKNEIMQRLENKDLKCDGYEIPICDMFPGEAVASKWAYTIYPVRLYNKQSGRYHDSIVHDRVKFGSKADIGRLSGKIYHHSFSSITELMQKMMRYTSHQAEDFTAQKRKLHPVRLLTEFPFAFLKTYLGRKYIFRGTYGLMIALTYACYRTFRVIRIYDRQLRSQETSR